MKRHIKQGIRLAGLNLSAVKFSKTKHVRLTLPINASVTAALLEEINALLSVQAARSVAISTATTVVLLKTKEAFPETNLADIAAGVAEEVAAAIDAMSPATDVDFAVAGKFVTGNFCKEISKTAAAIKHG